MPEIVDERLIMTRKELAEYCNCSKIPVQKQIEKLKLEETTKQLKGKEVPAYILTKRELSLMKATIDSNKGVNTVTGNSVIDNTITTVIAEEEEPRSAKIDGSYKELLDKYIEVKSMYDIAVTTQKLLEDRQASTLAEMQEIRKEKEELIEERASLRADITSKEKELVSTTAQLKILKKWLTGAGVLSIALLVLVLLTIIIK